MPSPSSSALTVAQIVQAAYETSKAHGFWDLDHGPTTDGMKIALMHSELSEALEAVRDGNYDGDHGVTEELADVVIRVADLCGRRGLDLSGAIVAKMQKNAGRPRGHGRKVAV